MAVVERVNRALSRAHARRLRLGYRGRVIDEERLALLAAFAVAAGAEHDVAWMLAADVMQKCPDDIIAASREVMQEAKFNAWGLG